MNLRSMIRGVLLFPMLCVVALWGGHAIAREEPPRDIPREERLQWLDAQCTKLTAEVKDLEARRQDYTVLDEAGNRFSNDIRMRSGELMHTQLTELDRKRNQLPNDRALNQAYNDLYDQYVSRMTELISAAPEMQHFGISTFSELNARFESAKAAWLRVESRYPLAKEERDRVCKESLTIYVDFFDANPLFLPDNVAILIYGRDYAPGPGQPPFSGWSAESLLAAGITRRIGAVTDGESRILIRVRTKVLGKVSVKPRGRAGDDYREFKPLDVYVREPDGLHSTFFLFTPPESFGPTRAARDGLNINHKGHAYQLDRRPLDLEAVWKGEKDVTVRQIATLWLFRPPVVLVHGTYDEAKSCWDWGPDDLYYREALRAGHTEYLGISFKRQLEDRGFLVFLVNYKQSNGIDATEKPVSSSHFRDNAKVVWHGGRFDHADRGEGIEKALEFLRSLRIAATKADVIGHSMGGVLARVYARGNPLPGPLGNPPDYASFMYPQSPYGLPDSGWYRRRGNWFSGDINRLITIGSTHKGSHIPLLLNYYNNAVPTALWSFANWKAGYKFSPGAFTDQIPGSSALQNLGATAVPAHAVACVATVADLDKFGGLDQSSDPTYRARMFSVWGKTPVSYLGPIVAQHTGNEADAREILQTLEEAGRLNAIKVDVVRELEGARWALASMGTVYGTPAFMKQEQKIRALELRKADLQPKIDHLSERAFLRYVAATFHNDWTDFTVSLDSQLGGFKEGSKWTTVLPRGYRTASEGILHGFEPRHRDVQRTVIGLLEGGMEHFNRSGFPAPSLPEYFEPNRARFRPHRLDCPASPKLCVPPR